MQKKIVKVITGTLIVIEINILLKSRKPHFFIKIQLEVISKVYKQMFHIMKIATLK